MKLSYTLLSIISVSFIVAGSLETLFPNIEQTSYVIHSILIGVLFFSWCGAHASESIIKQPTGAKLLSGLFPPIGVPYYLFKAFGFKQGCIKLILGILWFIFSTLLYALSCYVLSL